ncbi:MULTISPECIES: acyltransferase family protein [unclassified Frigoribacterium]|uniref:acyltransferase family protein n=1 Tax=unclassified Frigoribacterium TaxID=2627005 RepID=UPI000A95664E|nr:MULTISPECIES: acyltransferase family protein [unclassified Frigoribacterium]
MTRSAAHPPTPHRLDVQGLRALAVVAVVVAHATDRPSGGFTGVDVFFVVSGFLITELLVRERARTGTISLSMFYRRRARRILPAALVVLAATVAATFALYGSGRGGVVLRDAAASLGFVANWRFAATGTDYFTADGPVSPLQHFWSLAVEEQFYVVWPLLVIGAVALATRRRRGELGLRARLYAGAAIAVVGGASFAVALVQSASSPTVAYFSTATRAWELALGAGLALAAPAVGRHLPGWSRPALGWAGVAVIVVGFATVSESAGFPAPGALVPTLGTLLVLAAGIDHPQRSLVVLTNPVSRAVGDASYSIYLWHFPVVVLFAPYLRFLLGDAAPEALVTTLVLLVTAVLSAVSHRLVEQPVLRSSWLLPSTDRRRSGRRAAASRRSRPLVVAVAATVAVLAVTGTAIASSGGAPADSAAPTAAVVPAPPEGEGGGAPEAGAAQAQLTAEISAALDAESWPEAVAPAAESGREGAAPGNAGRCGSVTLLPAAECTFGDPDAPRRAVLVGDSIAQAYVPALAEIVGTGEWSLRIVSMYACPFVDLELSDDAARAAACRDRRETEYRVVEETRPDVVFVGNTFTREVDAATGRQATLGAWSGAFRSMLERLGASAGQTVVLSPPPAGSDVRECFSQFAGPEACVSRVSASSWPSMAQDQVATAEAVGAVFVDVRPWFCDAQGSCPAFAGDTLTKKDALHPTSDWMRKITPVVREALVAEGVVGL